MCSDLRGRGLSAHDPNWRNYQPGQYLADLARLAEVLDLRRLAVIGTSLGDLLAMMIGASAPESVAGIVLVARLRQVYGRAWPDLSEETWSMLVRRSYRADDKGIPRIDADARFGDALRASSRPPGALWSVFSRLEHVPMLLIHGVRSDILTEPILVRMQREKLDLDRLTVANRGHVPLLDEPEVLSAIDHFLAHLTP